MTSVLGFDIELVNQQVAQILGLPHDRKWTSDEAALSDISAWVEAAPKEVQRVFHDQRIRHAQAAPPIPRALSYCLALVEADRLEHSAA